MKRIRLFFINSLVMTSASLLLRLTGVFFNIYIAQTIGTVGMGLIEIIMSVYSFSVILAISGVGLASTRLVAEELAEKSKAGISEAMRKCITYALIFGIGSALLLFFSSGFIGEMLIKDYRSISSLKVLAISLPFISVSSAIYGYFTAVRRIIKSVAAQTAEQLMRIFLTVWALNYFNPQDAGSACFIIMAASCITETVSLFVIIIIFKQDCKLFLKKSANNKKIKRRMLAISLPIAFSTYACSALCTIKSLMIPLGLVKHGMSNDAALAEYGMISGMVMPVILFPSAFLSAFSSLLVPEVTECHRLQNHGKIDFILKRVFQATLLFSIGVAGIFLAYNDMFGEVIYKSHAAGIYIQILAPLVLIIYLDSMVDSMLKGLNQQVSSMFYNIIDSGAGIVMVYFFLPRFGISGLLLVMFVSKLFNTFLSVNRIITVTGFSFNIKSWILKPLICIAFSITSVNIFCSFMKTTDTPSVLKLALTAASVGILYLVLLRLTDSITKKDTELIKSVLLSR